MIHECVRKLKWYFEGNRIKSIYYISTPLTKIRMHAKNPIGTVRFDYGKDRRSKDNFIH